MPKKPFLKRINLDRVSIIIVVAAVIIGFAGSVGGYIFMRNFAMTWSMTDLPGVPVYTEDEGLSADAGDPLGESESGGQTPPLAAPEEIIGNPWDGASRVNVLVMGLDYRDWEAGETPRTDTMILFTIDPLSKTAGMLSIPRDMWVNIPGFDYAKINTAYYLGEVYKVPGGGPALAAETVEHFLGVPVDYYAQVDFIAFERFIDEIGGIVIHPKEAITIYPIGKPKVTLEPGGYRVGGDYALAYARTRYTEKGDFDRAERQQEVILAIRWQILSSEMLPQLAQKAPALYETLASGIRTNLTLQQVIQLALLSQQVDWENIRQAIIGPDVVTNAVSPDGFKIIIPIPDEIRLIRDEIFTTGGPLGPAAYSDNPMNLVTQEQARISIQNGSNTAGIATRTAEYFRSFGLNIVEETNADGVYDRTALIIYNGKPYTANFMSNTMGININAIYNQFEPGSPIDIALIVGNDWANNNSMP